MKERKDKLCGPEEVAAGLIEAGLDTTPDKPYLVMVSGGPDSSFLLWALCQLKTPVVAFHLDHGLRADSEADAKAASDLAQSLGVPIEIVRRKVEVVEGYSFETAARKIRYEEARRAASKAGCDWILTGHTADDQLETFFINLRRGAGLDGLKGIPRRSGNIVRPMLALWKDEIRRACDEYGISYVEDPTNRDPSILRNRIRLQAIPALEAALGEEFKVSLLRQTELLREDAEYLNSCAVSEIEKHFRSLPGRAALIGDARWFLELPLPIARRVVRIAFERLSGAPPPPSRLVARALEAAARGGSADLGHRMVFSREGKRVVIRPIELESPAPVAGEIPGTIRAPSFGLVLEARRVSLDPSDAQATFASLPANEAMVSVSMAGHVLVRAPAMGERFSPYGMQGFKPLADFLSGEGLCMTERALAPVLARADGTIVWVVGHRISNEAAVGDGETEAIHLIARSLAEDGGGNHKKRPEKSGGSEG